MRWHTPGIIGRLERKWRCIATIMVLFSTLALPGCTVGPSGPRHLDWLYIVPRNYMGFLVVRFMCPGGPSLRVTRDVANVTFAPDGVACIGDQSISWQGILAAEDTTRRFIPVRNSVATRRPPGDEHGYALFDDGAGTRDGYTFMAAWVGETQVFDQYHATDAFARDREAFLATTVDGRHATPGPIA